MFCVLWSYGFCLMVIDSDIRFFYPFHSSQLFLTGFFDIPSDLVFSALISILNRSAPLHFHFAFRRKYIIKYIIIRVAYNLINFNRCRSILCCVSVYRTDWSQAV